MGAARIDALVDSVVRTTAALAESAITDPVELRPGATDAELAALEAHAGSALPASLRELLLRTNGAPRLLGFFDLLSIAEMLPGSDAHERADRLKRTLVDDAPLIPQRAIVIADKGGDQPDCIYVDPTSTGEGGEWRVVSFSHEGDDVIDANVYELLERTVRKLDALRDNVDAIAEELE